MLSALRSGSGEGQQRLIYGKRRLTLDARTLLQQEAVPNDFRLLFQPVTVERATRNDVIAISAEWVAHQRQIPFAALLRLPHMRHFMDEMPLKMEGGVAKVGAE